LQSRKYLSRPESACYIGVGLRTIDRMLADSQLTRLRARGRVVILREELDRLVRSKA
jgi:hypothetical protein